MWMAIVGTMVMSGAVPPREKRYPTGPNRTLRVPTGQQQETRHKEVWKRQIEWNHEEGESHEITTRSNASFAYITTECNFPHDRCHCTQWYNVHSDIYHFPNDLQFEYARYRSDSIPLCMIVTKCLTPAFQLIPIAPSDKPGHWLQLDTSRHEGTITNSTNIISIGCRISMIRRNLTRYYSGPESLWEISPKPFKWFPIGVWILTSFDPFFFSSTLSLSLSLFPLHFSFLLSVLLNLRQHNKLQLRLADKVAVGDNKVFDLSSPMIRYSTAS